MANSKKFDIKPKILFIDDDDDLLLNLRLILKPKGEQWHTTFVNNFSDFITNLESIAPHIVVTDMHMPEVSGQQILQLVKERNPQTIVIVMTALPSYEAAVACMKLEAYDYITKPFDGEKIVKVLESALEKMDEEQNQDSHSMVPEAGGSRGEEVGGYRLIKPLGHGQFGVVYLAERMEKKDDLHYYAIKVLKVNELFHKRRQYYLERFRREAQAALSVQHPNVVKIIGYGIEDDLPFMVMEFVEGKTLDFFIESEQISQISLIQKIKIIQQITEGLAAIHAQKICHRDIKPGNIILDEKQQIKITDFGIAKLPESDLTVTTEQLGTPSYMSPESFVTAKIDSRTDFFSLGIIAYRMCVGFLPFIAENVPQLIHMVWNRRPLNPRELHSDFPVGLQYILGKMLKKRAWERYETASEIISDINRLLDDRDTFQETISYSQEQMDDDWCNMDEFLDNNEDHHPINLGTWKK